MPYRLRSFSGTLWRMLAIRFQASPLSGEGARLFGGRWNPRGLAALYLATDPATAVAEYYQGIVRPGTLAPFHLEAELIADLTDGHGAPTDQAVAQALDADWKALEATGVTPSSWELANSLVAQGAQGALVPSLQNRGSTNLVLWRWHDLAAGVGDGAKLTLLDPEHALSR